MIPKSSIVSNSRIESIQCIRAIAAILVVFCHSEQFVSAFLPVHMVKYLGQCFGNFGVDIFFVISGFIMAYISQDHFKKKGAALSFIEKRFFRIFPMYWLTTFVMLFILIPSGLYTCAFQHSPITDVSMMKVSRYVIHSILLIPYFNRSGVMVQPVVPVAWTLIYEMFFYYVFCLLLFFNKKKYLYTLTGIFALLIATQYIVKTHYFQLALNQTLRSYLIFYGGNQIAEFVAGCFVAELYINGKVLSNKVATLSIVLSIVTFLCHYHYGPTFHHNAYHWILLPVSLVDLSIPSVFVVYGLLSLESNNAIKKIPEFLIKLGNASYSIYLTHLSISLILLLSLLKLVERYVYIPGDIAVVCVWMISIILGYMAYKYIEIPITKLCRGFGFRKLARWVTPRNTDFQVD